MKIWAFDPGSKESGVAWVYQHAESWYAGQFDDPVDAWNVLEEDAMSKDDIILIEMYRSGGHLTKDAMATIEVVGFFKHAARLGYGWGPMTPVMRVEQHRLSGQREAAELMGGTIEDLRKDPKRKDAFSALAHCITYRRGLS